MPKNGHDDVQGGVKLFDPVLAELAYAWWCPHDGIVLDPFAGGCVRGIVASRMGRRYFGIDLDATQVDANRKLAEHICSGGGAPVKRPYPLPTWVVGDACNLADIWLTGSDADQRLNADFIFTCPPSTIGLPLLRDVVWEAAQRLNHNRFACFVVGDVRNAQGHYRSLPSETIIAFGAAGLSLYNEAIIVLPAGALPLHVGRQFESARKLGHTHLHVLVFVKGDAVAATRAVGPCEFGDTTNPEVAGEDLIAT